jgi:hypothetical protein
LPALRTGCHALDGSDCTKAATSLRHRTTMTGTVRHLQRPLKRQTALPWKRSPGPAKSEPPQAVAGGQPPQPACRQADQTRAVAGRKRFLLPNQYQSGLQSP